MKIVWTGKATADLVRLHDHLKPVTPDAAARIVQTLAKAPSRLIGYPPPWRKARHLQPAPSPPHHHRPL
jgi:plasmid stabilization system protein ParE